MNYPQVAVAVYQLATNFDPYLPQMSREQALAWASLFERFKFEPDDLLKAVENLYAEPHDGHWRLNVGQIVAGARSVRNDRVDRLVGSDTGRPDPRVAAAAVAAGIGKTIPDDKPRPLKPLNVPCPHCGSAPGRVCVALGSNHPLRHSDGVHPARVDAAARAQQQRTFCPSTTGAQPPKAASGSRECRSPHE